MKFTAGKRYGWTSWFAWYPVRTIEYRDWRWLEMVERQWVKREHYITHHYIYRPIVSGNS